MLASVFLIPCRTLHDRLCCLSSQIFYTKEYCHLMQMNFKVFSLQIKPIYIVKPLKSDIIQLTWLGNQLK